MSTEQQINRREFLKVSALAGAGLTIAICLPGCQSSPTPTETPIPTPEPTVSAEPTSPPEPTATPQPEVLFEPNIYLTIDNTGRVTIRAFRSEMGQGIRTAIAMIVAEELDADWATVRIEQSPTDSAYGNQVTGGSASVSDYYTTLRQAGASVRHMLVTAAAQMWGIEMESCRTESGWVINPDGSQRLAYGDVVGAAAELPLPERSAVQLKDPGDFSLIGSSVSFYDAPGMVDGSARYGSDVQVPGMLYATVARSPVFGGRVASFDASKAKSVAGVRDAVQIDRGVAIVADNSWAAIQGRAALEVAWEESQYANWSSTNIRQQIVEKAPSPDDTAIEAFYDIPFQAHATMEPMTCLADVRADSCEVWAPSQAPQEAKRRARSITKLSMDDITVHVPLLGGGFGRRHGADFVEEAVQISQAVGVPIKLVWTRDDDIQHDLYHPLSYTHVSVSLDDDGQPSRLPRSRSFLSSPMETGVPIGYWRSVENFTEAFARESFLDEIAAEKGLDPLELRLALLPERAQTVVELAAVQAEWGSPLPEGWGRGLAYWATFGVTHVAQVVEVSVGADGKVRVHRVVCAVDCGTVVNPDAVLAQMEGGIVFGLTAALKAEITIENGRVQQSNFHDYPLLRMDEMPIIGVHIVPSEERPSGIGEMGVPPIAPAVANAVYAATGKRIRRLPISAEALRA